MRITTTDLKADEVKRLRLRYGCTECDGWVTEYLDPETKERYLGCSRNQNHVIGREVGHQYDPNIKSLREELLKKMSVVQANKIAKYTGQQLINRNEAREIIESLFPKAPKVEQDRAILTCVSYGLNPLNKHVFLVPFNQGKNSETWALVMGIKAKRLLASRRGPFSYVDGTPRIMTKDEQIKTFGLSDDDRIWVITKVKDPQTGAEAVGYGFWLNDSTVYGKEKGNTAFNMAAIRSESQALDRLRPGEMPTGVGVINEDAVEGEYREITPDGEILEHTKGPEKVTPASMKSEAKQPGEKPDARPEFKTKQEVIDYFLKQGGTQEQIKERIGDIDIDKLQISPKGLENFLFGK